MSNNTVGEEKSHGADGAGFDSFYETCLFPPFFFFAVGEDILFFIAIDSTKLKQQPHALTDCLCPTVL